MTQPSPPADPEVVARQVAAKRVCLRCRQPFNSTWSGNRLCKLCIRRGGLLACGLDE